MMTVLEASSHVLIVTHAVNCSQATMAVVLILRYLLRVTEISSVCYIGHSQMNNVIKSVYLFMFCLFVVHSITY